ncbi:MAG: hypothetical protein ACJ8FY_15120 [Gemmataceae bacterium]
MQSANDGEWMLPPKLSEAVIRILRHEVGDLLQTVYSAAAVLNQRLPPGWELERRVVADMRTRAETCRKYLDYTHDIVCSLRINKEQFDASDCLSDLLTNTTASYPAIRIQTDIAPKLSVNADPRRLETLFQLLIGFACEAASSEVWVQVKPGEEPLSLDAAIEYNGAEVSTETCEALLGLNQTGQNARSRLALLLARKLVKLQGGSLEIMPRRGGGLKICIRLSDQSHAEISSHESGASLSSVNGD